MSWTLFNDWFEFKKEALESKDYSLYQWFLDEAKKEFTKLYIDLKKPKFKQFVREILRLVTSEMEKVKLKLGEKEVPF